MNRVLTAKSETYEYHSHALYSAVISSESVRMPECEVFDALMSSNRVI
jgi:hypothetical protein